jgi:hypothetical protein
LYCVISILGSSAMSLMLRTSPGSTILSPNMAWQQAGESTT